MTTERDIRVPGPDHPITVSRTPGRVRVTAGGRVIAETERAWTLREAGYPPVQYLPPSDVDASALAPSEHTSYCPYKGEARYHGLRAADGSVADGKVWYYAEPYQAVAPIAGHLAFCLDAADVEVLD